MFSASNRQLKLTEDGSYTLALPELNEHYHSIHGALTESAHVFIREGYQQVNLMDICILEVGFGTGLNAFLTLLEANKAGHQVNYLGLEPYPLSLEEAAMLNFPEILGEEGKRGVFEQVHAMPANELRSLTPSFSLEKREEGLFEAFLPDEAYDLVYFDAFAPGVQPDLWTYDALLKIYLSMKPGGVLTTYCAKGSVKRALKSCGFMLEHPRGPRGKREMTRALKGETAGSSMHNQW